MGLMWDVRALKADICAIGYILKGGRNRLNLIGVLELLIKVRALLKIPSQ